MSDYQDYLKKTKDVLRVGQEVKYILHKSSLGYSFSHIEISKLLGIVSEVSPCQFGYQYGLVFFDEFGKRKGGRSWFSRSELEII